jgi:hypothetical protein
MKINLQTIEKINFDARDEILPNQLDSNFSHQCHEQLWKI